MSIARSRCALRTFSSLAVLLACSTALAAAPPDNTCRAAKLKAAGKYASAALGCDAKAAKDGSAVDPACLTKGEGKLDSAFSNAESKTGVDCNGLDATTEAVVGETVSDVADAAPVPSGGGACVSAVHKAAGKFASSFLAAWSKFATSGDATARDAALTKARTGLAGKITKAETKTGCTSTGQGEAVRTAVEDGLSSIVGCLASSDPCVEEASEVLAGGTATTDDGGTGPSPISPVTAAVETPNAGTVTLQVADSTEAPAGYEVLGRQVHITAPDATAADPLVLTFVLDASLLPPDPSSIVITRDGVTVAACSGAPGTASPDPCVQSRTVLGSGDYEIVCLSSHASLWTPLLPIVAGCPTKMLWEMRADAVGDDRATEIDIGWKSAGHSFDPASGTPMTFVLDCAAAEAPCGTCDVTGFDPASETCRCANNSRTVCDQPGAADMDDCGGAQCQCFTRAPSPVVISGTPVCTVGIATNNPTGTWNVETGGGSVDLAERVVVYTGFSHLNPCPTCDGDTPGDGVAGGTCSGGASNGLSCEAHASDPTFPFPTGGFYSIDCLPPSGANITGTGLAVTHTETTGTSTLTASLPCSAPNGALNCPCFVCSGNQGLPCSSDAECATAGAGSCNSVGSGQATSPDNCDFNDCTVDSNGEGECSSSFPTVYCDGLTEEDGRGVIACSDNGDCDNFIEPGFDPGVCTVGEFPKCFGPVISATGLADPDEPRTVAATCVPPSSNGIVNVVFGLPGPARVRTDWFVTFVE
jgi:hypothetical protein